MQIRLASTREAPTYICDPCPMCHVCKRPIKYQQNTDCMLLSSAARTVGCGCTPHANRFICIDIKSENYTLTNTRAQDLSEHCHRCPR